MTVEPGTYSSLVKQDDFMALARQMDDQLSALLQTGTVDLMVSRCCIQVFVPILEHGVRSKRWHNVACRSTMDVHTR